MDVGQNKERVNKIGGYSGVVIGSLGWVIGLAIFVLPAYGTPLLKYMFIGSLISLSFAVMLIFFMELSENSQDPAFRFGFFGFTAFFAGVLFLLLTHWLAPFLEASPGKLCALQSWGIMNVYKVSDFVSAFWLAAGLVMLTLGLVRFLRQKKQMAST